MGHEDRIEQLLDNAAQLWKDWRRFDLERFQDKIQSPIEEIMLVGFLVAQSLGSAQTRVARDFDGIDSAQDWCGDERNPEIQIVPQVSIPKTRYTADFLVRFWRHSQNKWEYIVVECDGHDFHERTKEQATHDKKRDRDLTELGYKVLRFTGSEIWKNPFQCVQSVLRVADEYSAIRSVLELIPAPRG